MLFKIYFLIQKSILNIFNDKTIFSQPSIIDDNSDTINQTDKREK